MAFAFWIFGVFRRRAARGLDPGEVPGAVALGGAVRQAVGRERLVQAARLHLLQAGLGRDRAVRGVLPVVVKIAERALRGGK